LLNKVYAKMSSVDSTEPRPEHIVPMHRQVLREDEDPVKVFDPWEQLFYGAFDGRGRS
jgi:hypothetical protein